MHSERIKIKTRNRFGDVVNYEIDRIVYDSEMERLRAEREYYDRDKTYRQRYIDNCQASYSHQASMDRIMDAFEEFRSALNDWN